MTHLDRQSPSPERGWGVARALATAGGVGFLPGAPATYVSFLLVMLFWVLGVPPGAARLGGLALILLIITVAGTWAAERAEQHYGHDPRAVVIDEVVGMTLTALLIPWDGLHLAVAFLLFRAADVIKPPPVYQLQSLPGGLGVMVDDIAAGAYACGLLALLQALVPGF